MTDSNKIQAPGLPRQHGARALRRGLLWRRRARGGLPLRPTAPWKKMLGKSGKTMGKHLENTEWNGIWMFVCSSEKCGLKLRGKNERNIGNSWKFNIDI